MANPVILSNETVKSNFYSTLSIMELAFSKKMLSISMAKYPFGLLHSIMKIGLGHLSDSRTFRRAKLHGNTNLVTSTVLMSCLMLKH